MTLNPFSTKPAPLSQAARVFAKFGGVRCLMRALHKIDPDRPRDTSAVYRWNYSKLRGGTGGLIPLGAMSDVMDAARHEGILLTADDLDPRCK